MKTAPKTRADGRDLKIAVLHAAFNAPVVEGLLGGALGALAELGVRESAIRVAEVPGAYELPLVAGVLARSGRFDAIVALGAVIQGETDHYEHVAREAASGLAAVARETGVPVAFGALTVRAERQALERAAPGPENKGAEAARAAVSTAVLLRSLSREARRGKSRRGPTVARPRGRR